MMKRRGSALIIALLLISVIGGLAFGIGRLVFLETITATAYENGSIAYYAAESGIEEGFLRYRYDRNAEIPQGNVSSLWTLRDTKVYRNNLSDSTFQTGASNVGIDPTTDITDSAKQFYDLRLGYVGTNVKPWYGQEATYPPAGNDYTLSLDSSTTITADNTKKIDVSQLYSILSTHQHLSLFGKFSGTIPIAGAGSCRAFLEVTLTVLGSSAKVDQYKDFFVNNTNSCASGLSIDASKLSPMVYNDATDTFTVLNIDSMILAKAGRTISEGDSVSITIKPLYNSMVFGLTPNCKDEGCAASETFDHTKAVAGPFTTITSTGYYGGISRKISANIDRESGTLYDLYDYVLFKGN